MQAAQEIIQKIKFRFFKEFQTLKGLYLRHKILSIPLTISLGLCFLLAILIVIFRPNFKETPNFKLEAVKKDSTGVEVLSEFKLTSNKPTNSVQIRSLLKVIPNEKYSIQPVSDKEYRIKFAKELSKDSIYKFQISGTKETQAWAFQTEGSFQVIQTLPRDQASGVPLNSGIEVVFSYDNFSSSGIEKYFQISPQVQGRFEKHNRTLVFVPKDLQPKTLYTVTVKKGIPLEGSNEVLSSDKIFQFETESPRTNIQSTFNFSSKTYEFPASEVPVMNGYGGVQPEKGTIYKLDENTFVKSMQETDNLSWTYYQNKSYPTKNLQVIASFTPTVRTNPSDYLQLPQKLSNGFYLVELETNGIKNQAWLQITSTSAYATVTRTKTLFWVNSVDSKKAIEGASIELIGGGVKTATNKDGIGEASTPEGLKDSKAHYFKLSSGNSVLIVRATGYFYNSIADLYWHYFYLDRGLYRTSDSLSFWGVLKAREGNQPQKVKISIKQNSITDYYYNPTDITSKEVNVSDSGTFTGSLDFSNLNPGWYNVDLTLNNQIIESKSIDIGIFDKPAYQIKVTPAKKAYYEGEDIVFNIKTEFFEGTPAPYISLKEGSGAIIKTDSNGEAVFTTKAKYDGSYQNYAIQYIYLTPNESELGNISAGAAVKVFRSALALKASGTLSLKNNATSSASIAKVSGKVNAVDPSKVVDIYSDKDFIGAPVETDLTASVFETSQVGVQTGEYYDFIEKKNVKTYDYHQVRVWLKNLSAKSGKDGNFSFEFDADSQKDCEVIINAKDNQGRVTSYSTYLSRLSDDRYLDYYYLDNSKDYTYKYKVGDKVELKFKKGPSDYQTQPDDRFLYLQTQNGLRDYSVSTSAGYNFTFEEKHIPNVYVGAVLFNGFTYISTSNSYYGGGVLINYDQSEKELQITVKGDKQKYNPGDTAKLEVTVKDKNGKGVATETNLNIIDESLYAVSFESGNLDPLGEFYHGVSSGVVSTYLSHQYPLGLQGGGGGGGGGERTDFRDKVFFGVVKTGQDGKGTISVKLPDNLTSWRVSAQAFGPNMQIGKGGGSIVVSKDLFVEVNVPSEFLVTDKPEIKLTAFGNSLKTGDKVEFHIKAESFGWKKDQVFQGKAFEPIFVKLPDLKEGSHNITISVKNNKLSDTLVQKAQVISGRAMASKMTEYFLSNNLKLSSGSGRNTLTFLNEVQGNAYPLLERQLWSISDRLEAKLASAISADTLKKNLKEVNYVDLIDLARYQTAAGGLAIFPYADNDLELSTQVASYQENNFDKNGLRKYFLSVLDDKKESRERQIEALWGLAALGDPVLVQLDNAANDKNLSIREQLYIAIGNIELGNKEKARSIFENVLAKNKVVKSPYVSIKGSNNEDSIQLTALSALIASQIQNDSTAPMLKFLIDNKPTESMIDLENVLAAKYYLESNPSSEASFVLKQGSQEKSIKLTTLPYRLSLTNQQMKDISFKKISGKVSLTVYSDTPLNEVVAPDKSLGISRSYSKDNKNTTNFAEGDLVKVTINYTLPNKSFTGCYQVKDNLPTGLRAVNNVPEYRNEKDVWYVYENSGQTVSFCVTKYYTSPIKYFARVVSKGEYIAEPSIIQNPKAVSIINYTSPQTVHIN
jgi:hypothetical protein